MTKKAGRPATGRDPITVVRLEDTMLRRIDEWANQYPGLMRSAAIRVLIDAGLDARKKTASVYDPKSYRVFARDGLKPPPKPGQVSASAAATARLGSPPASSEAAPLAAEPTNSYRVRGEPRRVLSRDEIAAAADRAASRLRK